MVLGELLKDKSLDNVPPKHIDVFVAALTEDDIEKALQISYLLRRPYQAVNGERRSIRAEYSLGSPVDSLTKQLKLADARDARFVIVIGPEHQMKSEVELRDIKAKTREVVPENEVIGRLKALLANG